MVGTLSSLAACVFPFGALGLLISSVGWQVERSTSLSRAVLAARPVVLFAILVWASVLAFAPAIFSPVVTERLSAAALLSGPWGWVLVPIVDLVADGSTPVSWPLAILLLASLTAFATAYAFATAGKAPVEELARRAGLRRDLYTSVYLTDFRGASLVGREASRGFAGVPPKTRIPRPRHPIMAVPWRDAVWTLRNKGHVLSAALLSGGSVLIALATSGNLVVLFGAVVVCYLGASRLIESMRVELDAPGASLHLPYRYGDLLLLHAPLPTALLAGSLILSCTIGFSIGLMTGAALPAAVALCLPAAAALISCSALAAQRSRTLPLSVMQSAVALGDAGGIVLVQWYALGPILAMFALGVPALLLTVASRGPIIPWEVLLVSDVYILLFAVVGFLLLKKRRSPG